MPAKLKTPPSPATHRQEPFFWGGFPMAPWCNRATTDPVVVAGRRVGLAANFPDGSAIHGEVYGVPWDTLDESTLRIEAGGGAWPWRYEVRARFRVGPASAGLTLELRNVDDAPMPAGLRPPPWVGEALRIAGPPARVPTANTVPAAPPPSRGFWPCPRAPAHKPGGGWVPGDPAAFPPAPLGETIPPPSHPPVARYPVLLAAVAGSQAQDSFTFSTHSPNVANSCTVTSTGEKPA